MSLGLTTVQQRKAARLLRKIADTKCEALHFAQKAMDATSGDAHFRWIDNVNKYDDAHREAVHALADLLNVDIETRKERP